MWSNKKSLQCSIWNVKWEEVKRREIKQLFGAYQCTLLPHIYPDFWFNLFSSQTLNVKI